MRLALGGPQSEWLLIYILRYIPSRGEFSIDGPFIPSAIELARRMELGSDKEWLLVRDKGER